MIYLPTGLKTGDVIDPKKIAKDFIEVKKIASETSQFQWHDNSFQDMDKFNDTLCKVEYVKTIASPGSTNKNVEVLTDTGVHTNLVFDEHTGGTITGVVDPDMYRIPFNKGLHTIPGTTINWESKYPELIYIIFSYQYLRAGVNTYRDFASATADQGDHGDAKSIMHRFNSTIVLDGNNIVGSGPGGLNTEGSYRGLGATTKHLASSSTVVQYVSAGIHSVSASAAILPSSQLTDNEGSESRYSISSTLTSGSGDPYGYNHCIGNRNMIVVRFGRGKLLEG